MATLARARSPTRTATSSSTRTSSRARTACRRPSASTRRSNARAGMRWACASSSEPARGAPRGWGAPRSDQRSAIRDQERTANNTAAGSPDRRSPIADRLAWRKSLPPHGRPVHQLREGGPRLRGAAGPGAERAGVERVVGPAHPGGTLLLGGDRAGDRRGEGRDRDLVAAFGGVGGGAERGGRGGGAAVARAHPA